MATTPSILIRYTQDIGLDSRILARYIGNLEQGRSNVSVNSALSVGDKADHFRFKVTADEFVRIQSQLRLRRRSDVRSASGRTRRVD